jgi:hypothetical protein
MIARLSSFALMHLMIRQMIDYWEDPRMTDLVFVLDGDLHCAVAVNKARAEVGYVATISAKHAGSYDLIRLGRESQKT